MPQAFVSIRGSARRGRRGRGWSAEDSLGVKGDTLSGFLPLHSSGGANQGWGDCGD